MAPMAASAPAKMGKRGAGAPAALHKNQRAVSRVAQQVSICFCSRPAALISQPIAVIIIVRWPLITIVRWPLIAIVLYILQRWRTGLRRVICSSRAGWQSLITMIDNVILESNCLFTAPTRMYYFQSERVTVAELCLNLQRVCFSVSPWPARAPSPSLLPLLCRSTHDKLCRLPASADIRNLTCAPQDLQLCPTVCPAG